MRKIFIVFSAILFLAEASAQKIPAEKKDLLFKTPEYWKQIAASKLKTAPKKVVEDINKFNNEAIAKGFSFTIGYTNVWDKRITEITGFLPPDTKDKSTLYPSKSFTSLPIQPLRIQIPCNENNRIVDMRDYNIITPVRSQRNCGSCWAFASIAAFETAYLLKNGGDPSQLDLSEQQLLNCTDITCTCGGGRHHIAFMHMNSHNIQGENGYPYNAVKTNCENENAINTLFKARSWGWSADPLFGGTTIQEIKRNICRYGSVTAGICADSNFQRLIGDGVFNMTASCGAYPNHAIQIIGWNDDKEAWLIKNSWDVTWGFGGFGWVKYNLNLIGAWATWVEAEEASPVNSGNTLPAGIVDYNSADLATLENLINPTSSYRLQSVTNWTGDKDLKAGMVIDVDDPTGFAAINNSNKGRRVIQWSNHGSLAFGSDGHNQEWWFIPSGQRNNKPVYRLFNNGFLNFLTDNNSSSPVNENGNGSNNQLWELITSDMAGCFFLRNLATQRCVQVPTDMNEGSSLLMANMNTDNAEGRNNNQKFRLLRQPVPAFGDNITQDSWVKLAPSYATDKVMDLTAGNAANGSNIQIWQWMTGNNNQQWQIRNEGNYYTLKGRAVSNKCVEVYGFSQANAGNVVNWDCLAGKNQQWIVIECVRERGKYVLFNRNSGKCLEVAGWGRDNGSNVQQWEFVNGTNQKWEIRKAN